MKIFRDILSFLLASIAMIMTLGALYLCLISPSYIILYIFMAIIVWEITPNSWGMAGWSFALIIACAYLTVLFIAGLSWQPLRYLMSILLPICATLLLLKGKPYWIWVFISIVYLSVGCYCFFNNDIIGPMAFMIRDRPIDIPAQWYHCYRFFWAGVLLEMITTIAGFISALILFFYNVRTVWKDDDITEVPETHTL